MDAGGTPEAADPKGEGESCRGVPQLIFSCPHLAQDSNCTLGWGADCRVLSEGTVCSGTPRRQRGAPILQWVEQETVQSQAGRRCQFDQCC